MLKYLAEQIGADAGKFALFARRKETSRDHIACLMIYLATRSATGKTVELRCWLQFRQPRCPTTVAR
ncbi:hypothetical protein X739_31140 [Mesorhizobium sp. LNHC220B00]|nr:hypothetical protein X739_31140 [Mesorhizobium sp. LNHC220B00]